MKLSFSFGEVFFLVIISYPCPTTLSNNLDGKISKGGKEGVHQLLIKFNLRKIDLNVFFAIHVIFLTNIFYQSKTKTKNSMGLYDHWTHFEIIK